MTKKCCCCERIEKENRLKQETEEMLKTQAENNAKAIYRVMLEEVVLLLMQNRVQDEKLCIRNLRRLWRLL